MKKTEIKVDTIYHLKKDYHCLKICIIDSNRNNAAKNKQMQIGCEEVGMQSPGIFTDAKFAMEAGYMLRDVEDDHIIEESNVDDYLVIVDGNTRFHAWELSTLGEGKPFEYIFQYKKYTNAESFKRAYNTMNVYNTPTTSADFARDLLATSKNKVLSAYRNKIADGLTPKASGFATIGREIVKRDMADLQNGRTPSLFNDEANLNVFASVYESLRSMVQKDNKTFKGTEIWSWIANQINSAKDKGGEADKIIHLFKTMPCNCYVDLQQAKKDGNREKATVVKDILDNARKAID